MWKEYRDFVARGSVLDLAVGLVIGAAFGHIIASLVADILMPPIGMLLGRVDIANLFFTLSGERHATLSAAQEAGAVTVNYGLFLNTIVEFLIVGLALFLLIRQVNRLHAPAEEAAPTVKTCPHCCTEIPLDATRCPNCTSQLGGGV